MEVNKRKKRNRRQSALGRPIDPRYPTNRAIAIIVPIVMIGMSVFYLSTGNDILESIWQGFLSGLTVFGAWAFGREIDPDYDLSAFLAAGLSLLGILLLGEIPDLLPLFLIMMYIRVINRTAGLMVTPVESLIVFAATAIIALLFHPAYAIIGAIAFFMDAFLPKPQKRHLLFAGISIIVAIVGFASGREISDETALSQPYIIAVAGISLVWLLVILKSRKVTAATDITREVLLPIRVQAGQILALLAGLHLFLLDGDAGVEALFPLWMSMLGIVIYQVLSPIIPQIDLSPKQSGKAK